MKRILIAASLIALAGCTDANYAKLTSYGQTSRITCHSGDKIVFDDFSTGKVSKHDNSDGFYFVSRITGRLTEVTGTCTVDYGAQPGPNFHAVRL